MTHRCLLVLLTFLSGSQALFSRMAVQNPAGHTVDKVPQQSSTLFSDQEEAGGGFDFDFANDEGFMQLIQQIQDKVAEVEKGLPEETRKQLEVKRKTMEELEDKLTHLKKEASEAKSEMEELRQEVQQLTEEKAERKKHVKELREDVDRLSRQKKTLAEMVDDLADIVAEDESDDDDDSEEQLEEVTKELALTENTLESVRSVKRGVKRKLHIQSDRLAKAEGRCTRAEKDVKKVEEDMEKEEIALDDLAKEHQGDFMKAFLPEGVADDVDFENFDFQKMMEDEDDDDDRDLFGPEGVSTRAAA